MGGFNSCAASPRRAVGAANPLVNGRAMQLPRRLGARAPARGKSRSPLGRAPPARALARPADDERWGQPRTETASDAGMCGATRAPSLWLRKASKDLTAAHACNAKAGLIQLLIGQMCSTRLL